MEKELKEKTFTKIIIAKNSPNNGCFGDNGETLMLLPKKKVPVRDFVPHVFSSLKNKNIKSKYGWIKSTTPFTLKEFLDNNFSTDVSEEELECLLNLFESIEKLPEETTVAATYNKKSAFDNEMVLKVHKVFFYET